MNQPHLRLYPGSAIYLGSASTFSQYQPVHWPYQYPARWDYSQRDYVPPKALPWYYTCDPMVLLGWLALRVFAVEGIIAIAFYGLRVLS
jgi:hypothetical protein